MSILGWDFEDVDVSNGPVSSWVLSGEFAAHGVMAVGWPEGSQGVFVGPSFGPWTGGNMLFASPSEDGSSVLAVVLYEPSTLTLAFPATTSPSPAFEVSGRLAGGDAAGDGVRCRSVAADETGPRCHAAAGGGMTYFVVFAGGVVVGVLAAWAAKEAP